MKIRAGFVSNSSSSSFTLMGFSLGSFTDSKIVERIEKAMDAGKDIMVLGKYLYEARDVFLLCQDVWELMKEHRERLLKDDEAHFYFVESIAYGSGDEELPLKDLKRKIQSRQGSLFVTGGDEDQHSSVDAESFMSNYLQTDETNEDS